MNKQLERLKKDLMEVSDAVNAFQSKTVQVIVIDRVLTHLSNRNRGDETDLDQTVASTDQPPVPEGKMASVLPAKPAAKKMGATRLLNQLLSTEFFDTPKSIALITDFCATQYDTVLQTSEISGVLLKLIKENKLSRITSEETNRYVYLKPVDTTA